MKKIVFLIPSLGMGGMERVLVNYANLFVKHGYDVTVINFTSGNESMEGELNKAVHYMPRYVPIPHILHAKIIDILKLNFRILPWHKWIQFHSANYLYKKYITDKYDIEVAFCGSPAIKIISGSLNTEAQKLGWIHGDNICNDIPALGSYKNAKVVYSEIEKLICVSDIAVQDIKSVFGRTDKIYKVINPNDVERIREQAQVEVPRNKEMTFVCVGRIVNSQKGFDRVLEAASLLNEQGYTFHVWIVGDGPDYEALQRQKTELNLENVMLCGEQGNPYKFINVADVILFSSVTEAYGMVVTEALILGKPVISTDACGPMEILENGRYGMIVQNSVQGIYAGMKAVLDSPTVLRECEEKARAGMNAFDPNNSIIHLEKIFAEEE